MDKIIVIVCNILFFHNLFRKFEKLNISKYGPKSRRWPPSPLSEGKNFLCISGRVRPFGSKKKICRSFLMTLPVAFTNKLYCKVKQKGGQVFTVFSHHYIMMCWSLLSALMYISTFISLLVISHGNVKEQTEIS